MTIYKVFFTIAKKHLGAISLYFIIFAILTIVLSQPTTNAITTFEQEEIRMSIIDRDNSTLSNALTEYMDSSQELVPLEDNKEIWVDELFIRNTEYILIIPENFEIDMLEGKTDLLINYKLPGSTSGSFIDMKIDQYTKTLNAFLIAGKSLDTALADAENALSFSGDVTFLDESDNSSEDKPIHYFFFQYLPYIFICILINGLGPVLITFRKKELKSRTECSSMPLMSRNIQLILSSILFSTVVWALFMLLGIIQYSHTVVSKDYLLLTINSFVFMIITLSLTYLLVHFVKNKNVLNMISNIFGLGSSFLCGIFVPKELLGDKVLFVGQFLPPYWYIDAMENVFTNNMKGYMTDILIQIGFAVAFLMIALVISRQTAKTSS